MLLRTVWSVINRSPKHLLHEILLVDDASDRGMRFIIMTAERMKLKILCYDGPYEHINLLLIFFFALIL